MRPQPSTFNQPLQDGVGERAGQMRHAFRPVVAETDCGIAPRREIDRLGTAPGEPLRGDRPLTPAKHDQFATYECVQQRDTELAGKMTIAGARSPQRLRHASRDADCALRLDRELYEAFDQRRDIVVGQSVADLRAFITRVFETTPPQRKRFKQGFFTDGRIVTWEYPREAPGGEQMELVEIMEIEASLIKRHRVYWGWYALGLLQQHKPS